MAGERLSPFCYSNESISFRDPIEHPLKALSLFGVLIVAHLLSLQGHHMTLSAWMPVALFWQDVLVTLLFAFIEFCLGRSRAGWLLYAVMVVYAAINVPVTR